MATLLKIRQKSVDMEPELWLATQEARYASVCVCVLPWGMAPTARRASLPPSYAYEIIGRVRTSAHDKALK